MWYPSDEDSVQRGKAESLASDDEYDDDDKDPFIDVPKGPQPTGKGGPQPKGKHCARGKEEQGKDDGEG